MTQPLVATKLFIPRVRPGLVARDRLLRRLEDGAATRLTLVSAPPGYGKTTLLASWLARRGGARTRGDCAVAWLSLDAGDSDPASFWRGVATALRGAISAGGVPSEQLTASSAVADVSVPAVLNYLAETPRDVLLVLDDFHAADQPEVAAGLSFLVEHLPPHAHVVLCTRADPDLALARWRARGELVEIRAEDLRFTPQETATYLERADIAPLTVAQVAALDSRTEGWIAALQLAAISLAGRTDVAAFVEGFAGDNRFVVDYLVEEVLARQSPPVREFLLRSAVLERFCASLCDAVLARHDSDQMLRTLERANLFLVALDDRREWFRYHPLFADVLRARLRGEHPESVSLMHERAGDGSRSTSSSTRPSGTHSRRARSSGQPPSSRTPFPTCGDTVEKRWPGLGSRTCPRASSSPSRPWPCCPRAWRWWAATSKRCGLGSTTPSAHSPTR